MEKIAADAPLDYVEFQISPQNNYDVFVCCGDLEQKIGGALAHQVPLNLLKDSRSKGWCDNIKLQLPENVKGASWFSKATVSRFLQLTDSQAALKTIVALYNEISQLEETKKFHLSLYSQAENGAPSSDNSKNELLRAMDLRLVALVEELTSAFNLAAGEACCQEEMKNLKNFCEHIGYTSLRNTMCKLLDSSQNQNINNILEHKKLPVTSGSQLNPVHTLTNDTRNSWLSELDQPVTYDASPARATHVECQSSEENEENSSNSSEEEDQPCVDRSRTLTRSATPRRSASLMRRIQIGRSGSHRTPSIAIKSLSYFPGREQALSSRDTAQNDDGAVDGSEQTSKVPESNVRKMSVQDAINLFERKQRDQSTDVQHKKTQSGEPVKPVLRKWSSGVRESYVQLAEKSISENSVEASNPRLVDEGGISSVVKEVQPETCPVTFLSESGRAVGTGKALESDDVNSSISKHSDVCVAQEERTIEEVNSPEWNRQKEEELNQMLLSFSLAKPTSKYQKKEPIDSKNYDTEIRKRGGFSHQDRNRRNQMIQTENAVTKMNKELTMKPHKQAPNRAVRKSLDKTTKVKSPAGNSTGMEMKQVPCKTQKDKVVKRSPLSSNINRELPRVVVQTVSQSSLSAMRKSWPATQSPRSAGTTSTKTPRSAGTISTKTLLCTTTSGPASLHMKPQLSSPLPGSTPKVENPLPQRKVMAKSQLGRRTSTKSVDENKQQIVPKVVRKTREVVSVSDGKTSTLSDKAGVRSKVTKKSSVVPLESKSSINKNKSFVASPVKSPAPKKKVRSPPNKEPLSKCATQAKENLTKCETPERNQDDEVSILDASEPTNQEDRDPETDKIHHGNLEPDAQVEPLTSDHEEIHCKASPKCDEIESNVVQSPTEVSQEEDSIISSTAWVENGQQDLPVASESASPLVSSNHIEMASSVSRVHCSLSQMLLEESSEPDSTEWGNAENPPPMVFQKDAPKGLKRLLKLVGKAREKHL